MGKVKIITDSASDINKENIAKYDIEVLPFSILMPDGTEYLEQVTITYDEFYEKMLTLDTPPKTAQVNQYLYEEALEKYKEDYDGFIIVTISAASSATYTNALSAKMKFDSSGFGKPIEVFDSGTFTGGFGVAVCELGRMAAEGADFETLCENARRMIDSFALYAVIDDLKYLKISGRIKPLSFTLGSIFDIKPVVTIEDGLVVQKDKVRGFKKAAMKVLELDKKITADGDGYIIYLGCTTDNGTYSFIRERLLQEFPKAELVEGRIGATIGSHCGPGVIATAFTKKCR